MHVIQIFGCTHKHLHACMHLCTHITHLHACACRHSCMLTYTYTRTNARVHAHVCMHAQILNVNTYSSFVYVYQASAHACIAVCHPNKPEVTRRGSTADTMHGNICICYIRL